MDINSLKQALNLKNIPKRWETFKIENTDYEWLKEENLEKINNTYKLFPRRFPEILEAAKQLRCNASLMDYAVLLKKSMYKRDIIQAEIAELDLPTAQNGEDTLAYDLLPLLAMIPHLPPIIDDLRKRGVSDEIVEKTYSCFESGLDSSEKLHGRPISTKADLSWKQHYINGIILRIERLEFHRHNEGIKSYSVYRSENGDYALLAEAGIYDSFGRFKSSSSEPADSDFTAEYSVTDDYYEGNVIDEKGIVSPEKLRLKRPFWKKIAGENTSVLAIHIPPGPGLTLENIQLSYKKAMEIHKKCFPEFEFNILYTNTWLLDTQLSELLPKGSNILNFQSTFIPGPTSRIDCGIFSFLYRKPGARENLKDLPENTSLERAMKNHLLSGKHSYDQNGVIPVELIK